MRFFTIALVAALGAVSLHPSSVRAGGTCSDFDDGTVQGFSAQAATVTVGSPGCDGTAYYLRCGDEPSPPISAIIAPSTYYGDWRSAESICFCFRVDEDGWTGSPHPITTTLIIGNNATVGTGIQAEFILDNPIYEGDGWHSYNLPLHTISTLPLPSDGDGHWIFATGSGSTAADWNNLLANVRVAWFPGDIAGSPSQTEDFGVDSFCLAACGPTATQSSTWGTVKALYR